MMRELLCVMLVLVASPVMAGQQVPVAAAPAPVAVQQECCVPAPTVYTYAVPVVQSYAVQVQAVQPAPVVQQEYVECVPAPVATVAAAPVAYAAPVQQLETKLTWRQRRALKKQAKEARFYTAAAVPVQAAYPAAVAVPQATLGMER